MGHQLNQTITTEEYAQAVKKLLHLAQCGTGSSLAAAQVLLSAYNGGEWQLDITDLCGLDRDHYITAMNVIRGRVELMTEPHSLIKDGDRIFKDLWNNWIRYHISNRWKRTCDRCYGSGEIYEDERDESNETMVTCFQCEGEGLLGN